MTTKGNHRGFGIARFLQSVRRLASSLKGRLGNPASRAVPIPIRRLGKDERPARSVRTYRFDCTGFAPDDVRVFVDRRLMHVVGGRRSGSATSHGGPHCRSYTARSFHRTCPVPANVRTGDLATRFENGVLLVRVPGGEPDGPLLIEGRAWPLSTA